MYFYWNTLKFNRVNCNLKVHYYIFCIIYIVNKGSSQSCINKLKSKLIHTRLLLNGHFPSFIKLFFRSVNNVASWNKKKQLKYKFSYFPGFSFIYKYTMNAIYIVTSSFKLLPKQKKPNVSIEKKNSEAFTFTNSLQCCCALKKRLQASEPGLHGYSLLCTFIHGKLIVDLNDFP